MLLHRTQELPHLVGLRLAVMGLDAEADWDGLMPKDVVTAGDALQDEAERFQQRIRDLKSKVDVVIVQVQSGTEDTHAPSPRSIKALRAAADAGADLVVGNQAHWVQGVEVRDERFIAYALGNFIFDQVHTVEHTQGYLVQATYTEKKLVNVRLVPYQIANQFKPTFADATVRNKIETDVFKAAAKLPATTPP